MLLHVKVRRLADIDSENYLVIREFRIKRKVEGIGRKRLNTVRLKYREARKEVVIVRNRFAAFPEQKDDGGKHGYKGQQCKEVLKYGESKRKKWISENTCKGIETRREVKQTGKQVWYRKESYRESTRAIERRYSRNLRGTRRIKKVNGRFNIAS